MQYAVGLSLGLLLLVIYLPPLRGVFDTVPLSVRDWLTIAPLALIPPVAAEIRKTSMRPGRIPPGIRP
jgi:Ca2+-transporting ATPase